MIKTLLTYFIFLPTLLFAQEFTASVNETTVADNERFQISFTFSGSNINNLTKFSPPSFNNFMILSGPSQSTSIQIINGAQTASLTYSFIVQAKSVGTFNIGSASIIQAETTYETKPIKITVVKGKDKPQQKKNDSQISYDEIAKNLFVRATVNKTKALVGEQIILTYKLYKSILIGQLSPNQMPKYQGFWAEELETDKTINFKVEVVNGKRFEVGELLKVALFPTQVGTLEVTPLDLKIPVAMKKQKGKNIWDDFFGDPFNRYETVDLDFKSNIIKIIVKPLPAGAPESFNGAVGDFSFKADLSSTKTKSNEPLTLNVKVSGSGNIKLLDLPKINFPNGFEEYEPKIEEQINRKGRINGSKTGEYLFVPRVVGLREIPPLEFSFYNPSKGKYITVSSEPFKIDIKPGDKIASTEIVGKEDIRELGSDIRFIKTSYDDIEKRKNYIINSTGFIVASVLPFVLAIGFIGWKRRYDKLHGNVVLLRYQKAQKIAKNRLKLAKKLMDTQQHKEFYTELSSALFGYLEDKLHIPKSEFTLDRAANELRIKNVSDELINNLKSGAEKCEFVRFAPSAEKSAAKQEMYDEIADVIINIEKSIVPQKIGKGSYA
ncbi:MAG: BatD family protein [Ignavibacteria bacterium]|nr:BatD family protein [Ignavibacteria bacterium]MBT8380958.1 BatD family protein [Ignavibacteria bacterium]MBT8392360.1 BatD family protein [Ignavibacteria bacterium]NNJ53112.1 protein BatD [Ignavibacteriaceae bacterium]NNL22216.1 protein BatD [Ignavibacteriaceae bacterium]